MDIVNYIVTLDKQEHDMLLEAENMLLDINRMILNHPQGGIVQDIGEKASEAADWIYSVLRSIDRHKTNLTE